MNSTIISRTGRTLHSFLNSVIPFAKPGTPLWQELTHATVLCLALYYGPHVFTQARYQQACDYFSRARRRITGKADPSTSVDGSLGPRHANMRAYVEDEDENDLDSDDSDNFDDHSQDWNMDSDDIRNQIMADEALARQLSQAGNGANQQQYDLIGDLGDGAAGTGTEPDPENPRVRFREPPAAGLPSTAAENAASRTRIVGTKKARSIERRERRRAYHESLRYISDIQRNQTESALRATAAEREEAARRREIARATIDARTRAERADKRAKIEQDKADFNAVADYARKNLVRQKQHEPAQLPRPQDQQQPAPSANSDTRPGTVALSLDKIQSEIVPDRDLEWIAQTVKRAGIVGTFNDTSTAKGPGQGEKPTAVRETSNGIILLTKSNWLVRVDRSFMDSFYRQLGDGLSGSFSDEGVLELDSLYSLFEQHFNKSALVV